MYNIELKKKIDQANKVFSDVVDERSLVDYCFLRLLGESSRKLHSILRNVGILGAIVAEKWGEKLGLIIAIENAKEYIRYLTDKGYTLLSANEAQEKGLFCVLEDYKHPRDEKRFIVDVKFYTQKTLESFVYYSDDFILKVFLKMDGENIIFKETGKRVGKTTPAGRLLIQLALGSRKEIPISEILENSSQATQYKNIIYGHLSEVFRTRFPNSDITQVDSTLREQIKIQGGKGKVFVSPERVQFIFGE